MRLRLRTTADPRPALELTDTPRPNCPECKGSGERVPLGTGHDGPQLCGCWRPDRAWFLLALPRPAEPCCDLHRDDRPCCDPEDCGPCCADCPTCPTLRRTLARLTRKAIAR